MQSVKKRVRKKDRWPAASRDPAAHARRTRSVATLGWTCSRKPLAQY